MEVLNEFCYDLRENGRQKHRPLPTWSEIKPGHGEIFVGQQLQYYFGCYISTIIKGQLISEQIYGVLNFPKMQRINARISALASKMGQIKKVKTHYHPNYLSFGIKNGLFYLTHFQG